MSQRGSVDLSNLFRQCHDNEQGAWQELRAWFDGLAGRILSRFRSLSAVEREEAHDTAWEKLFREISSEDRVRARTNWMVIGFVKVLVTNCARDAWRRRRPSEPLPPLLRDEAPSPDALAAWKDQLQCAERLISSWRPQDQLIFFLRLEGVSTQAVKADAEYLFQMPVSIAAVDVRFSRLRTRLRAQCLGGRADGRVS